MYALKLVTDMEHLIRKPFAGKTEKNVLEEKQVTFDLIIITRFAPSSKLINNLYLNLPFLVRLQNRTGTLRQVLPLWDL